MNEEQILNLISICCASHGCTIKFIDFDKRIIDIDGPTDEAMTSCAEALEKLFEQYTK